MRQKIVFFGSGDYSIPVIEMLRSHGLELVLTTETEGPLITYLEAQKILYYSTKVTEKKTITKQELWDRVEQLQPTLGVLASFGAIIPQRIIDIFPEGIWNIHPSLLPKYKGPSPIQTTVLNGDTETGVTIITLDDQIDHGPILAQERVQLNGFETTEDLKHQLFALGAKMIKQHLTILEKGEQISLTPQVETSDPFTEKVTKEHGRITLEDAPDKQKLDNMVRAYYPWPTVWFTARLYGKEKLIKLLPEGRIQVEGKRVMTYKEFINGYQEEGKEILKKLGVL